MLTTTAHVRFISFLLLTASGAACQEHASVELSSRVQGVSRSPEIRGQQISTSSYPDAPSWTQTRAQAGKYRVFALEVGLPSKGGSDRSGTDVLREAQISLVPYREILNKKVSSAFWDKYMHAPTV